MRVLLVKMSSLGDVVHALPAVTDAAARGVTFDWVVEEAFAAIPGWHPAVRTVLPIAWRRWRRRLLQDRQPLAAFVRSLRAREYDLILDAQGLVKSAAVTALARAPLRAGFNFTAAREPAAAFAYRRRAAIPQGSHAVDRQRALFAEVLGYPLPGSEPEFGLTLEPAGGVARRCLLLHGTTWASKHWPQDMWHRLAADLAMDGWQVELPWGNEQERRRALAIASAVSAQPGATEQGTVRVLEALSLAELGRRIAGAELVVGVDSGLAHLAGALGVPTLVLYGSTSALRTGVRGARVQSLQSGLHCAPCLARECRYRGEPSTWRGEPVFPPCYALLPPERVREEAVRLLERRI